MSRKSIRADRPGTIEVRRVACACIGKAQRMLSPAALSDGAVHEARKEIKKSRAAVRLLRTALGSARYHRENERLREAGRALNAVRDAKVLVRTLDLLRERDPQLRADPAVSELSRRLRAAQRQTQRLLRRQPPPLRAARRTLQHARFSASQWPVGDRGWARLGPAFKRIYAAGRDAARVSRSKSDHELMHEWRKQVKYLWHALQVFQPLEPDKLRKHAKLAQRLADDLGDEHDLAVLRAYAIGSDAHASVTCPALLRVISQCRRTLRKQAFELGERVYAVTPRQMDQQMQRYWHRWHRSAH
jgi:CHAD domain-containing protein